MEWAGLPLPGLGKNPVSDFADHLRRKFHAVEIFQLVMDIPCTHPPRIQGNHLFLYAGNIPLVFGNQLRLKHPVSVTGDINLEFTVLAFKGFGGMSVSLVVGLEIPLLVFLISQGGIHFCFHQFLEDVFETVPEKGIDIRDTGDVVF